jgi:acyl carrier protein
METKEALRKFIAAELKWDRPEAELTDDYPLLEREVVDSLGIFKIISFVESEFDVEVDDDELVADNFATIEAISTLVGSKLA